MFQVDNETTELLTHPVIKSYLNWKWITLGSVYYGVNVFVYIVFVACLSLFALTVNNPLDDICKFVKKRTT